MKSIPSPVWVVPLILLMTSRLSLNDDHSSITGYYVFTNIVTCGSCSVIAFFGFRDSPVSPWSVPLVLVALLFNPFVPIRFSGQIWSYLDLGTAALLGAHLILVRWAPYPIRVRRIFRLLVYIALAVALSGAGFLLLLFAVRVAIPPRLTAQDIEFIPWVVGISLFVVLGGVILFEYLNSHPIRDINEPAAPPARSQDPIIG